MSGEDNSSATRSGHREKVKEKMGDGGGCAEAWEAAQELRNEKAVSSERRNFVAGIGASLLFGVSPTKAIRDGNGDGPGELETEVRELEREERAKAIKQALTDEEVKRVRKSLKSRGLKEDRQSATAYRSTYQDEEHLTVRIPFDAKEKSGENRERTAGILWSSWSSGLTHGFISERELAEDATVSEEMKELYEESGVDLASMDTVPVEHRYTIVSQATGETAARTDSTAASNSTDGTVSSKTRSTTVPVRNSSGRQVSTQGVADCACTGVFGTNPVTACAPCGTHKPECLAQIVSTFGAEIGACGGCAIAAAWTGGAAAVAACVPCLGAISESVASGRITDICCWCNFGGEII